MAPNLRLTDGTTTKTLTAAPFKGFTYFPMAPGGGFSGVTVDEVTESAELLLEGTAAAVRAAVNDVERLLDDAARRQETDAGPKVYVEYQAVSGGDWWRSEITAGRVAWDEAPGARRLSDAVPKIKVAVHWTRRHFWEGALAQLHLTSGAAGTQTLNPVAIYNNDDATAAATNWIGVGAAQVGGALPTPVKLEVLHNDATAVAWRNVYVCNEYLSPMMTAFLRGEQANGGAAVTISAPSSHNTSRWVWDLTPALLADLAGRYWRLLMWFAQAGTSEAYWRAAVAIKAGGLYVNVWEGDEVLNRGRQIMDLGAVPIPPGGYDTATSNVSLVISCRSPSSLGTYIMDFVQFTPAASGQYRKYYQNGFLTEQGDGLIDDGPEGLVYYYEASGVHYPLFLAYGEPIYLWPGRAQRLRVLYDETTLAVPAGKPMTARAWYRPRRAIV